MLNYKKNKNKIERGVKKHLITAANPKSPISEQYRTIRTNIQFSMIDKKLKTLAFTSATPGEGKSTTISNLAVTLALQDEKVLLIDADLRKPTIHQLMEVRNRYGLTSLISQRVAIGEAILPTFKTKNLDILPSGPIPHNPSELLGSKMMQDLIVELSQKYDWLLFDTPPVLAVTDAQVLGSLCDGVILVLKSHRTEKKELIKAKELLEKANTNLIGTVINGVDAKEFGHSYYGDWS